MSSVVMEESWSSSNVSSAIAVAIFLRISGMNSGREKFNYVVVCKRRRCLALKEKEIYSRI